MTNSAFFLWRAARNDMSPFRVVVQGFSRVDLAEAANAVSGLSDRASAFSMEPRVASMGSAAMTRVGGLKPPALEMALWNAPLPSYGKA